MQERAYLEEEGDEKRNVKLAKKARYQIKQVRMRRTRTWAELKSQTQLNRKGIEIFEIIKWLRMEGGKEYKIMDGDAAGKAVHKGDLHGKITQQADGDGDGMVIAIGLVE